MNSYEPEFAITAKWPESVRPDEHDNAHLRIQALANVLTRVADLVEGSNRDYLKTSAVSMAIWFADNWWRLRWEAPAGNHPGPEWRIRHELSSGSGHSVWPPVMIYGTGGRVVIAPALGTPPQSGRVRFLEADQIFSVSSGAFEEGLDTFFEQVISNCARARDGQVLAELVWELAEERQTPELADWRRLEARLGFDPDEAPETLVEGLLALEGALGAGAVEEAATAAAGLNARVTLDEAVEASKSSPLEGDLRVVDAFAADQDSLQQGHWKPWQIGETVATELRSFLSLRDEPFTSEAMGDVFRISNEQLRNAPATASKLAYACRLQERQGTDRFALQSLAIRDRRFEIARMIGDALWGSHEPFGVISRAKTDRQKFQRAFAQSLLVPFEALMSKVDHLQPSHTEIVRAAKYFNVHPNVVTTILVNKNILPRETLADRLEAA